MPITKKNHAIYNCTLRQRSFTPETETFFIQTGSTSTLRTSCAVQEERATRMKNFLGPFAGKNWLLSYKNRQLCYWVASVGLIIGILFLAQVVQPIGYWRTNLYNNLHYGMPRTTQVDAYVGHETGKTPSRFIAENLRGQVLIIEFPGGDVQHAYVIAGPRIVGPHADQIPVLLSFVYINWNHLPDMVVSLGSQEFWYANMHGTFVYQ